jgi:two-component system, cell cycle sensor histidine kinase and response regulator CckA
MPHILKSKTEVGRLRNSALLLAALWMVVIGTSLVWNIYDIQRDTLEQVTMVARGLFQKDLTYRRWAASHGGVYVPLTDTTPANPNLSHLPDRDITTLSGQQLTLLNPAYMTRQVFELTETSGVVRSHITSLKPIRAQNAPDPWEQLALENIEQGANEVAGVAPIDNQEYLRFMRPVITEKTCLKCHAHQGYTIGDIRGGISVSIPMKDYWISSDAHMYEILTAHCLLALFGFCAIGLGARHSRRNAAERDRANKALMISEQRFRTIADYTADWEYWMNPSGTFNYVSPSCQNITGYSAREFLQSPELNKTIIVLDDQKMMEHHFAKELTDEAHHSLQYRIIAKDQSVRWIDHHCSPVYGDDGSLLGRRASNRDVTEQRMALDSLQESQQRMAFHLEHTPLAVVEIDLNFCVAGWNPAAEQIFGYSKAETQGKNLNDLIIPCDNQIDIDKVWESLKSGTGGSHNINENNTKNGNTITCEWFNTPMRDEHNNITGAICIAEEITERKFTESVLHELVEATSNVGGTDFFQNLVRHLATIFHVKHAQIAEVKSDQTNYANTLAVWTNDALGANYEYELTDTPCDNVVHQGMCYFPQDVQSLFPKDTELATLGVSSYFGVPLRDTAGRVHGLITVMDDKPLVKPVLLDSILNIFSTRAAMELERMRSEQDLLKWAQIFQHATWGIAVLQADTQHIEMMNPAFSQMHGYTAQELTEQPFQKLLPDEEQALINRHIANAQLHGHYSFESRHLKNNDAPFPVFVDIATVSDAKGNSKFLVVNVQDITVRKEAEAKQHDLAHQVRQTQKMESLGVLAGGIAHDFNNILGIIMGSTEIAESTLNSNPQTAANCLQQSLQGCERAKDLVQQILTFSRQAETEHKPLQLTGIIKDSIKMLRASIPTTVTIQTAFNAKSDIVMADTTELQQVIMNLATNAAQAMSESGNTLSFSLEDAPATDTEMAPPAPAPAVDYVRLQVADTGQGIEQAILDRIFEPFFSTKPRGEGTGLGLAVVHGIIESYKGYITVDSIIQKGTTFTIWLPVLQTEASTAQHANTMPQKGTETILFVDDEFGLVSIAQKGLSALGYTVHGCAGSLEALDTFRQNPELFDLVVTDQTMPGMTGGELTKKILSVRPELPVILCTGFSEHLKPEDAMQMGISKYLEKPLTAAEISAAIRDVLDSQTPST